MLPLLDADTLQGFREEVESYLPAIRAALEDESRVAEACRLAHSIKGAAALVGMEELATVAEQTRRTFEQGGLPEPERSFERISAVEVLETAIEQSFATASLTTESPIDPEPPSPRDGDARAAALEPRDLWISDLEEVSADLLATFQQEAEELLSSIGDALRSLRKRPADRSLTEPLRRHVHTLKGASGMVGLHNAGKLAHRLEDCLDRLNCDGTALDEETLALLQSGADLLEELCIPGPRSANLRDRTVALHHKIAGLGASPLERLGDAVQGKQPVPSAEINATASEETSGGPSRPGSRLSVDRIDELLRLSGEATGNHAALESAQAATAQQIEEIRKVSRRLQQLAERLESRQAQTQPVSRRPQSAESAATPSHTDFDELELDRYTELGLLACDLTELAAAVAGAGNRMRSLGSDLVQGIKQLGRLNAETQDRLMQLRMAPLSSLRRRLERTVRVTASASGKQVEFEMQGDVSLDQSVLNALVGPLDHLLRNAVDHGVEDAELRRERGKPAHGTIRLRVWLEGVQAAIDLTDDGGGFDLERLRAKAVEAGLLDPAAASQASSEQLHRFAFHAGLSTADRLSETSGRGVGLDAVRSSILALSGAIRVRSEPGGGAVFSLRLPTSLAAARLLLVRAADQTFALPLYSVTRVLRTTLSEVCFEGDRPTLSAGNEQWPLVDLNEALGLPKRSVEEDFPALLIEAGDQRYALAVERLLESRDAVIKSLGPLLRSARGLSGATVLGDGSVCLVLNPAQLTEPKTEEPEDPAEPAVERRLEILVVDDSLSVRTVAGSVIESRGWRALTARDGLEALEALETLPQPPDAVLLDVEMPRMDGYELLTALRSLPRYQELPVVMLTSRAGDKHRERAFALGANNYLIKPFEPESLLEALAAAASQLPAGGER